MLVPSGAGIFLCLVFAVTGFHKRNRTSATGQGFSASLVGGYRKFAATSHHRDALRLNVQDSRKLIVIDKIVEKFLVGE